MTINYVEELTVEQRSELNKRIAEGIKNKDAFTTDADVRYFETEDYLEEINVSHYTQVKECQTRQDSDDD